MRVRTRLLPLLMVLISLGATLAVAVARIAWERGYRTVTIAVSYADLDLNLKPAGLELKGARDYAQAVFLELTPEECAHLQLDGDEVRPAGLALVVLLRLRSGPRSSAPTLDTCLEELERLRPRPWALAPIAEGPVSRDDWERLSRFLEAQPQEPLLAMVEFHTGPLAVWAYRSGYRNLVRAHLIEREELESLDLREALARWRRAVREREVRLLLVHLPMGAGGKEGEEEGREGEGYLHELARQLKREGFELGLIGPPREFHPPTLLVALIALGPLGLGLLGCSRLDWGRSWDRRWAGAGVGIGVGTALVTSIPALALILGLAVAPTAMKLALAWLVAVLTPVLAYLLFPAEGRGLGEGLRTVFAFTGLALLGGLWVGTLLAGTEFFLKVYQFRGVKAALVLPVLIPLALHLRRHRHQHGLSRRPRLGLRPRPRPVGIALLLLGMAVLLLAVMRSGNLAFLVSGTELRLRGLLEGAFYVRPRFKEFLLGHPALLLWGSRPRSPWGVVLLGLGLLGQASIINTFAHLHTPLLLSLLRTANGLVLGLLLGVIAYLVRRGGERLWPRRSP